MKVIRTGIFEAKRHLSELVQKVREQGVTYCITKRGEPVAELRPIGGGKGRRRFPLAMARGRWRRPWARACSSFAEKPRSTSIPGSGCSGSRPLLSPYSLKRAVTGRARAARERRR
ncbi:MAG: type II toxin-antitoxin system Phd/YefM family antitoxin [Oceanipulchritudo sp.]